VKFLLLLFFFYHYPLPPDNGENAINKTTVFQKLVLFLFSGRQDINIFLL